MDSLFDELARAMATPMPRSRAFRILGRALVAAAVPAALRPGRAFAHAGAPTHASGCEPKQCKAPFPFLCDCRGSKPSNCSSTCGVAGSTCCCFKDADGTLTGVAACPPDTRCGRPGEPTCVYECDVKCGSKCCDRETQYCASQAQSLCCEKGEDTCRVLAKAGSGQPAGPAKCCPKKRPKCCANDGRANCCDKQDNCCAGRCCPPAKKCERGVCKCPKDTTTCGPDCCKKGQTCCGNKECCKKGETCSQGKCCPTGHVNCGGKGTCCDEINCCNGTCCDGAAVCVNNTCCPPARRFGTGRNARCCPPNTVPVQLGTGRFGCCPPAVPNCCESELPCLPGSVCVSGGCVRL